MSLRRFTILFASVLALAFGGAVTLNYAVDPFDLYITGGRPSPPVRRETGSHGRLHKAYALINLRPSVVALGASRTEAAISMTHPGWSGSADSRYNASVTAANLREIWALLQLAASGGKLHQALIGLEFYSFNAYVPNRPDFDAAVMAGPPRTILGIDPGKARYYCSFDALMSSARTIANRSSVTQFLPDGRVNPLALEEVYRGFAGQKSAFMQTDREALQLYYLPPPRRIYRFADEKGFSSFDLFRQMLEFARERHVDLRLYISPAHARSTEVLHMLGLSGRFEEWQRELVRTIEAEAASSGGPAFPLWDFSGYSSVSAEAMPPDDPNGPRSRWYWESSHYRAELGDLVLDRIFGHQEPGRTVPPDFGVRLASGNIDEVQRRAREGQAAYRAAHAAEMAEMERIPHGR